MRPGLAAGVDSAVKQIYSYALSEGKLHERVLELSARLVEMEEAHIETRGKLQQATQRAADLHRMADTVLSDEQQLKTKAVQQVTRLRLQMEADHAEELRRIRQQYEEEKRVLLGELERIAVAVQDAKVTSVDTSAWRRLVEDEHQRHRSAVDQGMRELAAGDQGDPEYFEEEKASFIDPYSPRQQIRTTSIDRHSKGQRKGQKKGQRNGQRKSEKHRFHRVGRSKKRRSRGSSNRIIHSDSVSTSSTSTRSNGGRSSYDTSSSSSFSSSSSENSDSPPQGDQRRTSHAQRRRSNRDSAGRDRGTGNAERDHKGDRTHKRGSSAEHAADLGDQPMAEGGAGGGNETTGGSLTVRESSSVPAPALVPPAPPQSAQVGDTEANSIAHLVRAGDSGTAIRLHHQQVREAERRQREIATATAAVAALGAPGEKTFAKPGATINSFLSSNSSTGSGNGESTSTDTLRAQQRDEALIMTLGGISGGEGPGGVQIEALERTLELERRKLVEARMEVSCHVAFRNIILIVFLN